MDGIAALDSETVHRICSNQVVFNLHGCVKELIENSIDAGASSVEVRFRDSGTCVEVIDNGSGISAEMYTKVTSRHCTSKIENFEDIESNLNSFGFRGEALASICALAKLEICTRVRPNEGEGKGEVDQTQTSSELGTRIVYDHNGEITETKEEARGFGTTVKITDLFKHLPVRHREFMRSLKTQLANATKMLQSYAILNRHTKFYCVTEKTGSAARTVLVSSSGKADNWRSAVTMVFGSSWQGLQDVQSTNDELGVSVTGLVSSPLYARRTRDNQYFYVNGRPVDLPKKMSKSINDLFRQFNSKGYPAIILEFRLAQENLDVNVTPDKKTFFLKNESLVVSWLVDLFQGIFSPKDKPEPVQQCFSSTAFSSNVKQGRDSLPVPSVGDTDDTDAKMEIETTQIVVEKEVEKDKSEEEELEQREEEVGEAGETSTGGRANVKVRSWQPSSTMPKAPIKIEANVKVRSWQPSSTMPKLVPIKTVSSSVTNTNTSDEVEKNGTSSNDVSSASSTNNKIVLQPKPFFAKPTSFSKPDNSFQFSPETKILKKLNLGSDSEIIMSGLQPMISVFGQRQFKISRRRIRGGESEKDEIKKSNIPLNVCFPGAFSLLGHDKDTKEQQSDLVPFAFDQSHFLKMSICGQFNHGFIMASLLTTPQDDKLEKRELFIIDQHAADEKKRFENFNKSPSLQKQPLAQPWRLRLNPTQEQIVEAKLDIFAANGFAISIDDNAQSGQRCLVNTLPVSEQHRGSVTFKEDDILELIEILKSGGAEYVPNAQNVQQQNSYRSFWGSTSSVPRPPKVWVVMASRACRGAIMIGAALRDGQMREVVDTLASLEQPWNCPHGRPTCRHVLRADSVQRAKWSKFSQNAADKIRQRAMA